MKKYDYERVCLRAWPWMDTTVQGEAKKTNPLGKFPQLWCAKTFFPEILHRYTSDCF